MKLGYNHVLFTFLALAVGAVFLSLAFRCVTPPAPKHPPRVVIYDDDFGADFDVATSMATLHKLADQQLFEIRGMIVDSGWPRGAAVAQTFNTFYLHSHIPIATYKGPVAMNDVPWAEQLTLRFKETHTNSSFPDCKPAYRSMLVHSADRSVTIISTGALTCLAQLLRSPGDELSSLTGVELVRTKVRLLIIMGGYNPSGSETNLLLSPGDSQYVFNTWTSENVLPPIYMVDYSLGAAVLSGPSGLFSDNNPGRLAFDLNHAVLHASWDAVAILFAAYEFETPIAKEGPLFVDLGNGTNTVDASGYNHWSSQPRSGHHFLGASPTLLSSYIDGYQHCCGYAGMEPGSRHSLDWLSR